jgi:hypothetical protein
MASSNPADLLRCEGLGSWSPENEQPDRR